MQKILLTMEINRFHHLYILFGESYKFRGQIHYLPLGRRFCYANVLKVDSTLSLIMTTLNIIFHGEEEK